jgi:trimeric autotransporter adhesin
LLSSNPQLLADINTNGQSSNPTKFVAVGATTFFVATDAAHGSELWRTDGTTANTSLIKDINPGPGSSDIGLMAALGGKLFFYADDGVDGEEPWVSDGTTAGTMMLKDVNPGSASSNNGYGAVPVMLGGKVFFQADDGIHGTEVWSSDGTAAGTAMVKDINPGTNSSYPYNLTLFQGAIFFTTFDPTDGHQLWRTDGTSEGTAPVKTLNFSGRSFPTALTPIGNTLFFASGDDVNVGNQLWRSDGTTAGTAEVTVIPGPASNTLDASNVEDIVNVNGAVYFIAQNNIWKSDGTATGTKVVSTAVNNLIGELTPLNGGLAFERLGNNGRELWDTDGTSAGTHLVMPIDNGIPQVLIIGGPRNLPLTVLANKLYFAADDGVHGPELWRTDGTTAGSNLVMDINPNNDGTIYGGSNPDNITVANGRLFFSANDEIHGAELWTSLGKASSTVMVKDITLSDQSSAPAGFVGVGTSTYFEANDGIHGKELYKTDGTTAGTTLIKDINPGGASSNISQLIDLNGEALFSTNDGVDGTEPWISDGTAAGTTLLKDIFPGTNSYYGFKNGSNPSGFTVLNGKALFSANDGVNGDQLWETDGTTAGTTLLKDIFPGTHYYPYPYPGQVPNDAYPGDFVPFQGKLFFQATDANGDELWQTDGTSAGTTRVKDIRPGTTTDYYGNTIGLGSDPSNLTVANGHLFFTANDGVNGTELWETDGTAAGTVMVKDINPGPNGSNPYNLTVVGKQLFFTADDGVDGRELWLSDGTAAGTMLVKDINPGPGGLDDRGVPLSFANVNGLLLFTADDGTHGLELWRSDGTPAGTSMVRDINPGPTGSLGTTPFTNLLSGTSDFAVVGKTLYFAADDGVDGRELWQSDGTPAGTSLVADINPGPGGSIDVNGQVITAVNGTLYFQADDGVHGTEPWVILASVPSVTRGNPAPKGGGLVSIQLSHAASNPPHMVSPSPIPWSSTTGANAPPGGEASANSKTGRALPHARFAAKDSVPLGPLNTSRRRPGQVEEISQWDRRFLLD